MKIDLSILETESMNKASEQIDTLSALEIVDVINQEDQKVALAVKLCLPQIAQAVDRISQAFHNGGRLIYCGAGTSGRLGILDASECPPTYGTPREQVIGLIAGGPTAILQAVENAEDNPQAGEQDLRNIKLSSQDVVVGISASGRTPYVLGAMNYALSVNATVISVSCNRNSEMGRLANIDIAPVVGAEVVTGSSRMKAGTAQKMVLNMLTTASMIRVGKVYGNLMVDVEATNAKLLQRQVNIVMQATDCTQEQAIQALQACDRHCKTAILMLLTDLSAGAARQMLESSNGFIRQAIKNSKDPN